eukprot:TRINITY_DN11898_c0_g2_i1.p1 TRINITY_DN11898_c0_g2~~TRINITY_DN11898_c0_g2_i1.p1  ORF type:complete len:975 (+),score=295.19 TRINITY_DN11898_c0_g2_i1:54-2978(+)
MPPPPVEVAVRIKPAHRRGVPHSTFGVSVGAEGAAEEGGPVPVCTGVVASRDFQCEHVPSYSFCFDRVFDVTANTLTVWQHSVRHLAHSAIAAGDGLCFVYGERRSGRTYTVFGTKGSSQGMVCPPDPAANLGLLPLSALELLRHRATSGYAVEMSAFALRNESVTDLLAADSPPDRGPRIGTGPLGETVLRNFRRVRVDSVRDVVVAAGGRVREASGCHVVVTLFTCPRPGGGASGEGRLHFVLFAGSDTLLAQSAPRAGLAAAAPPLPKQAVAVQAVLSVMKAVAHARTHIPYRASKLTRFLKDSLNAHTPCLFLHCAATTPSSFKCALSALKLADRLRCSAHPLTSGETPAAEPPVEPQPRRSGASFTVRYAHGGRFDEAAHQALPVDLCDEDAALLNLLSAPKLAGVRAGRSEQVVCIRDRLLQCAAAGPEATLCGTLRQLRLPVESDTARVQPEHLREALAGLADGAALYEDILKFTPPADGVVDLTELLAADALCTAQRADRDSPLSSPRVGAQDVDLWGEAEEEDGSESGDGHSRPQHRETSPLVSSDAPPRAPPRRHSAPGAPSRGQQALAGPGGIAAAGRECPRPRRPDAGPQQGPCGPARPRQHAPNTSYVSVASAHAPQTPPRPPAARAATPQSARSNRPASPPVGSPGSARGRSQKHTWESLHQGLNQLVSSLHRAAELHGLSAADVRAGAGSVDAAADCRAASARSASHWSATSVAAPLPKPAAPLSPRFDRQSVRHAHSFSRPSSPQFAQPPPPPPPPQFQQPLPPQLAQQPRLPPPPPPPLPPPSPPPPLPAADWFDADAAVLVSPHDPGAPVHDNVWAASPPRRAASPVGQRRDVLTDLRAKLTHLRATSVYQSVRDRVAPPPSESLPRPDVSGCTAAPVPPHHDGCAELRRQLALLESENTHLRRGLSSSRQSEAKARAILRDIQRDADAVEPACGGCSGLYTFTHLERTHDRWGEF